MTDVIWSIVVLLAGLILLSIFSLACLTTIDDKLKIIIEQLKTLKEKK